MYYKKSLLMTRCLSDIKMENFKVSADFSNKICNEEIIIACKKCNDLYASDMS
jgi:hypothetical protein